MNFIVIILMKKLMHVRMMYSQIAKKRNKNEIIGI